MWALTETHTSANMSTWQRALCCNDARNLFILWLMIVLWLFWCCDIPAGEKKSYVILHHPGRVLWLPWRPGSCPPIRGQRSQPAQDVRLIPENSPGSSWEKVSEQPVQQQSPSVPVAPLFLNEWGCLITGAETGAASLVYKRLEQASLVPESKSKPKRGD